MLPACRRGIPPREDSEHLPRILLGSMEPAGAAGTCHDHDVVALRGLASAHRCHAAARFLYGAEELKLSYAAHMPALPGRASRDRSPAASTPASVGRSTANASAMRESRI